MIGAPLFPRTTGRSCAVSVKNGIATRNGGTCIQDPPALEADERVARPTVLYIACRRFLVDWRHGLRSQIAHEPYRAGVQYDVTELTVVR